MVVVWRRLALVWLLAGLALGFSLYALYWRTVGMPISLISLGVIFAAFSGVLCAIELVLIRPRRFPACLAGAASGLAAGLVFVLVLNVVWLAPDVRMPLIFDLGCLVLGAVAGAISVASPKPSAA
jgi:hypothetical protein